MRLRLCSTWLLGIKIKSIMESNVASKKENTDGKWNKNFQMDGFKEDPVISLKLEMPKQRATHKGQGSKSLYHYKHIINVVKCSFNVLHIYDRNLSECCMLVCKLKCEILSFKKLVLDGKLHCRVQLKGTMVTTMYKSNHYTFVYRYFCCLIFTLKWNGNYLCLFVWSIQHSSSSTH